MDGCFVCFGGLEITFTDLYGVDLTRDGAALTRAGDGLTHGGDGFAGGGFGSLTGGSSTMGCGSGGSEESLMRSLGMGKSFTGDFGGSTIGSGSTAAALLASLSASGLESLLLAELLELLELLELELELLLELLEDLDLAEPDLLRLR